MTLPHWLFTHQDFGRIDHRHRSKATDDELPVRLASQAHRQDTTIVRRKPNGADHARCKPAFRVFVDDPTNPPVWIPHRSRQLLPRRGFTLVRQPARVAKPLPNVLSPVPRQRSPRRCSGWLRVACLVIGSKREIGFELLAFSLVDRFTCSASPLDPTEAANPTPAINAVVL